MKRVHGHFPLFHRPKKLQFRHLMTFRQSVQDKWIPIGYEDETGFHYGRQEHKSGDGGPGSGNSPAGRIASR
jgi:hypothetical protein